MANSQKGKIDMTTGHIMRNIILFAIINPDRQPVFPRTNI